MDFPASSSDPYHDEDTVYGGDSRDRRDTLRASVLDVAMQLGIGSSRTLQNWIFDAVDEADEGDPDDDELILSDQRPQLGRFKSIYREEFDAATLSSGVLDAITKHPAGVRAPPPPIPNSPPKTQSKMRNRLRKGRKSDETEPDIGYLSEGGAAAKRRAHKAKRAAMRPNDDHTDDEGYLSEATKKKRPFFRNMLGGRPKEMPPISTPQPLVARQPSAPASRSRSPLPPAAAPTRSSTAPSSHRSRSHSPLPPPPRMSDSRASSPARSPLWLERSLTPTSATSQSFVPHSQSAHSTPPRSPLPAGRSPLWLERSASASSLSGASTPEPRTPSMNSKTVSPSQSKPRFS